MEVDEEKSIMKHVEKQKSMITHKRTSVPAPSPEELAGRESRVRFCPWAFRLALDGAGSQWNMLLSKKGAHLWVDCFFPIGLTIVFGFVCSYGAPPRPFARRLVGRTHLSPAPRMRPAATGSPGRHRTVTAPPCRRVVAAVFEMDYHYPKETWTFFSAAVAFLLTSKLSLAYARYWDGRGHVGTAVKCCRAIAILIKPRLGEDVVALDCADDARRYSMLYYWTMCFQLLGMKSRGMPVVMQHLEGRPEEEELLFERPANTALTALVWLSARVADLAEAGVLSQHELQENCRIVNEMVDAFNGATKLKNTPIPLPMEHLCAVLTNLYVYTSPLALATAFRLATNSICYGTWLRPCRVSAPHLNPPAHGPARTAPANHPHGTRAKHPRVQPTHYHSPRARPCAAADPSNPGTWSEVPAGTPGSQCMSVPMFNTFYGVWSRTCFSCFCLGLGYFGIFELGNTFAGQPPQRQRALLTQTPARRDDPLT